MKNYLALRLSLLAVMLAGALFPELTATKLRAADELTAFRDAGLAPGLYFSPEDFSWLWRNKRSIERRREALWPANNPSLLALDQAQIRELLTRYGPVDYMFFDGPPQGLREEAWK